MWQGVLAVVVEAKRGQSVCGGGWRVEAGAVLEEEEEPRAAVRDPSLSESRRRVNTPSLT